MATKESIEIYGSAAAASPKKFSAYWGNSFYNPGTKVVDRTAFSAQLGYDEKELAEIDALVVGQVWTSHDYGSAHTVTRIQ